MHTFLEETLIDILKEKENVSESIFILPSKRACGFFKQTLAKLQQKSIFSPKVISIEEFIEEISSLKIIDPISLLLKSYKVYLETKKNEQIDTFETYASYALTLLNDFSEIDRYLIDAKDFFNYLTSIKTIEKWGVKNETSSLIKDYLLFWEKLPAFYFTLQETLSKENLGYQGMVYRKAAEDIEHYGSLKKNIKHYFLGFNALNNAEQTIIQELIESGNTKVYWDIDHYFLNDKEHSASFFINRYFTHWKSYKNILPNGIANYFETQKEINFVETQTNIEQVKYVGELLHNLAETDLAETAIVLADEELLIPLLYSLPDTIKDINVTMGLSIKSLPESIFFSEILSYYKKSDRGKIYYKEIQKIIHNPIAEKLFFNRKTLLYNILLENSSYSSLDKLLDKADKKDQEILKLLFGVESNNHEQLITNFKNIVSILYTHKNTQTLQKTVLSKINNVFSKLEVILTHYKFINNTKELSLLLDALMSKVSLDIKGNAHKGLQIMGVLETRVIDFNNIIILSMSEGILPAGKSNNSFITYDMKVQYKLPLSIEKDAVYSYHFYHMLQRAQTITLLYNNASGGLTSGEKSRFLLQLELEKHPKHSYSYKTIVPFISLTQKELKGVSKTERIVDNIKMLAGKGFSPSSLTSYIRNPIDFYNQKILKINETMEIEETVSYQTLGNIVHHTLENLYTPFLEKELSIKKLEKTKLAIAAEVSVQFKKYFKEGSINTGKNLIIFEVVKRYILSLIQIDINALKKGNIIKLIALEQSMEIPIEISGLNFPIKLKGTVDRIDSYNHAIRIIDYKTGKVEQKEMELIDWEELYTSYNFSKAFQVLAYAYMYQRTNKMGEALKGGVISFKNLQQGFMCFSKKPSSRSQQKEEAITEETLKNFEIALHQLIIEICNPNIPFLEKEIKT